MDSAITVPSIPTVTVFTRHSEKCPHIDDEFYKGCKCSKHLRWSHAGKQYRKAAKTRSWTDAQAVRRKIEAQFEAVGSPATVTIAAPSRPTIERAIELYVSDKRSQGLNEQVLKKYKRELERFQEFMAKRSKFFPHEITLEDLTEFRAGWVDQYPSSTTRVKVQERLRGFLRYCYDSRLIDRVPRLSAITPEEPPTLPLSEEQYQKLLAVIPKEFTGKKAIRVRAMVRLMRYSGLAIVDAVTLERQELMKDSKKDGSKETYRVTTARQKTGVHVSVIIPHDVADEVLAAMKLNDSPKYVFWNTGTGKPQTAVTNWQHDLRQAFRAAGMPEGHPHQLRDTFAVSLLEKGVPLEEVSKLLGHESIKTTEKHYAPWVQARQDRLDALVTASWA